MPSPRPCRDSSLALGSDQTRHRAVSCAVRLGCSFCTPITTKGLCPFGSRYLNAIDYVVSKARQRVWETPKPYQLSCCRGLSGHLAVAVMIDAADDLFRHRVGSQGFQYLLGDCVARISRKVVGHSSTPCGTRCYN